MWLNTILKTVTDENTINTAKQLFNQQLDGAKEAGRHTWNTWRNIASKTPDDTYTASDNLVNDANILAREAQKEQARYYDYIYDLGLDDETSKAIGRAFHKTGISDNLLDDILSGKADWRKQEMEEYLSGLSKYVDDDIDAGIKNMVQHMIDESLADEGLTFTYRNADAFRNSLFKEVGEGTPSHRLGMMDDEGYQRLLGNERTLFDSEYRDYLRLKAWDAFDQGDKDKILRALRSNKGDDVKKIFSYRRDIDRMSDKIADDFSRKNLLPNYTYRAYEDDVADMIVSAKQADEMVSLGAGKVLGTMKIGGKELVRIKPSIDFSTPAVQGALKISGKHTRGSSIDLAEHAIPYGNKEMAELAKKGYVVDTVFDATAGKEISLEHAFNTHMPYSDYRIGKVRKPLSEEEQLIKKRMDSAHDVISNTIGKLYKDRNSSIMRIKVDTQTEGMEYINLDTHKPLFISYGPKVYNPLTMSYQRKVTPQAVEKYNANKALLDKDYINLAEEGIDLPIVADFVHKDYYRELLGYQHWRMTEGLGWKAKMLETLHSEFIDFVRSNISIKNPAVLLNNTIAGIGMQVTDNIPLHLATQNTYEAFGALKRMHYLEDAMFRLEQQHKGLKYAFGRMEDPNFNIADAVGEETFMAYDALRTELHSNIAYQAEKAGVLKSFLDEGLWDRRIKAGAHESFDKAFAKNLLLTEDSKWGINVRKWHDYSDMMNRVAMFKYLTQQADEAELLKKGIQSHGDIEGVRRRIDEMFVNYSKLLPPMIASMRRGGAIPFAQWFFKAPPFMLRQIKEHPVRALAIFAAYETLQTLMDDEHDLDILHGDFKDAYIGDVHTDSKYSQNALRPANWLDAVNPIGMDTKTWIPSYMSKVADSPLSAIGVTTKEY